VLLAVWLLTSLAMVVVILRSIRSLERARARWRPEVVEGVPVLVSAWVGPAALGVVRGAIVVPEWALALEGRFRRLLLLHESEHLRAGDPRLLLAGLLAVAVMPWNPALWWQFRRLRQAMELDCDTRVLRAEPDPRSYGLLLLEVGRRRGGAILAVPGLAESRSFLERRIRMLGSTNLGSGRLRAAGGAGAAALLVLLACEARGPNALEVELERVAAEQAVLEAGEMAGSTLQEAEAAGLARLQGSATRSCSPLYLLDGVPVEPRGGERSAISRLDPAEIESIEVIKGGAAVRILGEHPAGDLACGVVRVTTKGGAGPDGAATASAPTQFRVEGGLVLDAASAWLDGGRPDQVMARDVTIRGPQRSTQ
jgi:hypothetical protein